MRFDKFTTKFQQAFADAQSIAVGNDNPYIEPQHLLSALLEQEESLKGKLVFNAGEVMVRINDRLLAPNEPSTWKAVEPGTRAVLSKVFGDGYSVEPAAQGTPELFTLQVRAPGATGAAALLARL